jgi:hypothetical protein
MHAGRAWMKCKKVVNLLVLESPRCASPFPHSHLEDIPKDAVLVRAMLEAGAFATHLSRANLFVAVSGYRRGHDSRHTSRTTHFEYSILFAGSVITHHRSRSYVQV